MIATLANLFNDSRENIRGKVIAVYALLLVFNAAAWLWAIVAFHNYPVLLGTAALAYSFGLRHAFDADHIAAIDNVTRKLMQEGRRPVGVGLFFSLGHSTIVVALTVAIAVATTELQGRFDAFKSFGGIVGTLGVGVVPVRHRDRQHHRPRLGVADVPNRQERRAGSSRKTST